MKVVGMNDKAVVRGTELRLNTAFTGVTASFPAGVQEIVVNGKKLDRTALLQEIESVRAPWKSAREAHAVIRQFTQDKPDHKLRADELLAGLEAAFVAHFGRESEELTKFGFKPYKRRRPLTVEENILRTAKGKLTRAKRGTLGKKQRAALKAEGTPEVRIDGSGMKIGTGASNGSNGSNGHGTRRFTP